MIEEQAFLTSNKRQSDRMGHDVSKYLLKSSQSCDSTEESAYQTP